MKPQRVTATLTVHGGRELTTEQLGGLLLWLDEEKRYLLTQQTSLAKQYTAKYWLPDENGVIRKCHKPRPKREKPTYLLTPIPEGERTLKRPYAKRGRA